MSKKGPAYINPCSCSICRKHISNLIGHSIEDSKEIYDVLKAKESIMLCPLCSLDYSLKEGYNEFEL